MAEIVKETNVSIKKTLLTLKVGEEMEIKHKIAMPHIVHAAAIRLRKKGYGYFCTVKGLPESTKVIRLK